MVNTIWRRLLAFLMVIMMLIAAVPAYTETIPSVSVEVPIVGFVDSPVELETEVLNVQESYKVVLKAGYNNEDFETIGTTFTPTELGYYIIEAGLLIDGVQRYTFLTTLSVREKFLHYNTYPDIGDNTYFLSTYDEFGVIASTFEPRAHTQTNFAVKTYNNSAGQYSGADLTNLPGKYLIGNLIGDLKLNSRKDNKEPEIYIEEYNGELIDDVVERMLSEISAAAAGVVNYQTIGEFAPLTNDQNWNNNNCVIDLTELEDTTIYINYRSLPSISEGGLDIHMRNDQIVVFNVPDDGALTIPRFKVNGQQSHNNQGAYSEDLARRIIWNAPYSTNVRVQASNACLTVIAPSANAFIAGGNWSGWLIADYVTNDSEIHFENEHIPGPDPEGTSTPEPTPEITPTPEPTPTVEVTPTLTTTVTPSPSPTNSPSPTPTIKVTPTPTPTNSPSPTPTVEITPSPIPTIVPTPTVTVTPTVAPTPTPTIKVTQSPTPTIEPTPTPTIEVTVTPTPTATVEITPTPTVSATPEVTPSPTPVVTNTPEPTEVVTPTPEVTNTPEPTPTVEATPTPEPTEEVTPTPEITAEPTPTITPTAEPTSTPKITEAPTIEPTPVVTDTPAPTETPAATSTPIVTEEPESTPTIPMVTNTPESEIPVVTPVVTATPVVPTDTSEPTPEPTPTPMPKMISISGQKNWIDNNNAFDVRPEQIVVRLMRNGELMEEKTVTAQSGWRYTFTNLPDIDETGTPYDYTVGEKMVTGYYANINGYNITNTIIPNVQTTTVIRNGRTYTTILNYSTPLGFAAAPIMTEEDLEGLVDLMDYGTPLWGGLLATGDDMPIYPFIFGGLGFIIIIAFFILRKKRMF